MSRWLMFFASFAPFASLGASDLSTQVDYLRDVKPILRERCYACHGTLKQEGGLRLDSALLVLEGGGSGSVIEPSDSVNSVLIERVSASDEAFRMPPEGRSLNAHEIATIKAWIDQGAIAPIDERPEESPQDHWAFRPPSRPSIPYVDDPEWSRHPIDAFIAAEREKRRLRPVARAPRALVLRRLYLDLIGLPPTRRAQQEFFREERVDAVERLVDRLLASPRYGERWGRHWMDIWRYTDWYGLGAQLRNGQKHIWRWRDWIVESLNSDKGYDQMILEMLAADEIAPTDRDALRATGFLARNYYLFNRTTWLDDTIEHTSKAFLGLTLNCAKCHDHKYDPLTQTDYYRMRAIFEPHQVRLDPVPGEVDLERDGLPRVFDAHLDAPTYVHVRGDPKQPDTKRIITPGIPELFSATMPAIFPVELPTDAYFPDLRPYVVEDRLRDAEQKIASAQAAVEEARVALASAANASSRADNEVVLLVAKARLKAAERRPDAIRAVFAADRSRHGASQGEAQSQLVVAAARATRLLDLALAEANVAAAELDLRNSVDEQKKKGAEKSFEAAKNRLVAVLKAEKKPLDSYTPLGSSRKALEGPGETAESRAKPYPRTSSGRRTALARWIVHARNPLTARVAVNHIWARHFGQPLVESVADFGRRSRRPPQKALLDWLAVELIENDWSMKHLHRLMVTSQTYALGSSLLDAEDAAKERDPDNELYWRRRPLRMESQVVRDSFLWLAGALDSTIGGSTVDPQADAVVPRRSLYFTHSRDVEEKFLSMFDNADILRCYRRVESVVPQQALTLANSRLGIEMSRRTADRLSQRIGTEGTEGFIRAAYELILSVAPGPDEVAACLDAIHQLREQLDDTHPDPVGRARQDLVHALFNHNDFITIR